MTTMQRNTMKDMTHSLAAFNAGYDKISQVLDRDSGWIAYKGYFKDSYKGVNPYGLFDQLQPGEYKKAMLSNNGRLIVVATTYGAIVLWEETDLINQRKIVRANTTGTVKQHTTIDFKALTAKDIDYILGTDDFGWSLERTFREELEVTA